jgi:hypothetical protein
MSPDEPERIWVSTKWRVDQLNEKRIEFRLPLKGGGIASGIGELSVASRISDDLLSVQIVTEEPSGAGLEKHQRVIPLSEECVSGLEPHQNRQLAQFRLVMA